MIEDSLVAIRISKVATVECRHTFASGAFIRGAHFNSLGVHFLNLFPRARRNSDHIAVTWLWVALVIGNADRQHGLIWRRAHKCDSTHVHKNLGAQRCQEISSESLTLVHIAYTDRDVSNHLFITPIL